MKASLDNHNYIQDLISVDSILTLGRFPRYSGAMANSSRTVAICIPASSISRSRSVSLEHDTHVAYQIAKACSTYNVSEIVVFDNLKQAKPMATSAVVEELREFGNKKTVFEEVGQSDPTPLNGPASSTSDSPSSEALLLASLLQVFVTPPYLMKPLFRHSKFKKKLAYAMRLPTISTLPFMRNEKSRSNFKEGLTVSKQTPKIVKKGKKVSSLRKLKSTPYVNVGDDKLLKLNGPQLPTNVRVTVDMKNMVVVSPQDAYGSSGASSSYGFQVRYVDNFKSLFTELSFEEGYSESIYIDADTFFGDSTRTSLGEKKEVGAGPVMMMLGNYKDYQRCFESQKIEGISEVSELFDGQIMIPASVRVEDAVCIALAKIT